MSSSEIENHWFDLRENLEAVLFNSNYIHAILNVIIFILWHQSLVIVDGCKTQIDTPGLFATVKANMETYHNIPYDADLRDAASILHMVWCNPNTGCLVYWNRPKEADSDASFLFWTTLIHNLRHQFSYIFILMPTQDLSESSWWIRIKLITTQLWPEDISLITPWECSIEPVIPLLQIPSFVGENGPMLLLQSATIEPSFGNCSPRGQAHTLNFSCSVLYSSEIIITSLQGATGSTTNAPRAHTPLISPQGSCFSATTELRPRSTGRAGHGMPRLLIQPEGRRAVVGGGIPGRRSGWDPCWSMERYGQWDLMVFIV